MNYIHLKIYLAVRILIKCPELIPYLFPENIRKALFPNLNKKTKKNK
jgi:hypothetical protein